VGRRNYVYFLWFVFSIVAQSVNVFISSIIGLHRQRILYENDDVAETTHVGALIGGPRFINWVLLIYTVISGGFAGVLLSFHCKLIYLNVSTNEYLKDRL